MQIPIQTAQLEGPHPSEPCCPHQEEVYRTPLVVQEVAEEAGISVVKAGSQAYMVGAEGAGAGFNLAQV